MYIKRLGLLFDRRLVIISTMVAIVFSINADAAVEDLAADSYIEMELKADPYASYKQRRTDWSYRYYLGTEIFLPNKYVSPADGSSYTATIGQTGMSVLTASIGTQYNTRIGAFFIDLFYGSGSISQSGTTIGIAKTGASLGIFLDTIFDNPYVSPYLSYQAFQMGWREVDPASSINIGNTISMMSSYQFGLSVHLDKIDPISSGAAYTEYGLKNSFIDIYGYQNMKSANLNDPDFSSELNYGINFRLEF